MWLHDGAGSKYTSVFQGSIYEIGKKSPCREYFSWLILQGDQLNMLKVTCPVYATVHMYTRQVTFYNVNMAGSVFSNTGMKSVVTMQSSDF